MNAGTYVRRSVEGAVCKNLPASAVESVNTVGNRHHNNSFSGIISDAPTVMTDYRAKPDLPFAMVKVKGSSANASRLKLHTNASARNLWFRHSVYPNVAWTMINHSFQNTRPSNSHNRTKTFNFIHLIRCAWKRDTYSANPGIRHLVIRTILGRANLPSITSHHTSIIRLLD
jgi:hypothetical protein